MSRKVLITVAVGVVVLLVVLVWASLKKSETGFNYNPTNLPGKTPEEPPGPVTREVAPTNVVVPGREAKNVPKDVAVPSVVSPGSPSGDTSYRSFSINISGNQFLPSTVIVKKGDTINLNFTATDHDYDFTQPDFGLKALLPKGSNKRVQFGATVTGKFTFYCSSCGGPSQGPVGYVIITP